jgi:hypothetical protein
MINNIELYPGQADQAVWRPTEDDVFSVRSAYQLHFIAMTKFACAKPISKSKAPMKCKFFMWLAVHHRCLTANNLARRGWPHSPSCPLCSSANEDCTHLFVRCCFTQQVWARLQVWANADFPIPDNNYISTEDWWLKVRKRVPKDLRRDFDTPSPF